MDKKLLLVDGHNLLFQMFFGMPSRIINNNGIAIQGVVGFIGALRKIVKLVRPTHALIIFDSEGENVRLGLLPEYKANRPDYSTVPDEDNPFVQLPYIYRALDLIGIPYLEAVGCECDDVIASYARSADRDTEVFISSYDSDYFQLITDRIKCIRYKGESSVILGCNEIIRRYGVAPPLFADFKALVGDRADNIRGVRGIGPKTAAGLLTTYGNLDKILYDTSVIEDMKLRGKISAECDHLFTNLKLIRLEGTASLPFSEDDLVYKVQDFKTMDIIRRIGL